MKRGFKKVKNRIEGRGPAYGWANLALASEGIA
jgi:hypothetical protein